MNTCRLNSQYFKNTIFCRAMSFLQKVQSSRPDRRVHRWANLLEDPKLQNDDTIAQSAMYHKVCLSNLY